MNNTRVSYMIRPNTADMIRLGKAAVETGCDTGKVAAVLVHNFFNRLGINNPPKKVSRKR